MQNKPCHLLRTTATLRTIWHCFYSSTDILTWRCITPRKHTAGPSRMRQSLITILGQRYSGNGPTSRCLPSCRKISSLTMSAVSSAFSSTLLYALVEERHFALVVGCALPTLGLALNRQGQELSPTQPSLRSLTAIKIRLFELPSPTRERDAQSLRR